MKVRRSLSQIVLAGALGAALAACGSSGSGSSTSSPTASSPASASATTGATATQKAIEANWTAFFDAKTPVATRVKLLQDGPTFASVIQAQAGSGLAAEATAKVSKVAVTSSTQATVTYSILVGGQPALADQNGVAVFQDGTWKVGVASFCGLLTIENGGKTSSLPAACKTAG